MDRKVLEQKEVYQQFKDMESRGEFEAAKSYLELKVKKQTASDPDSTTLIIETGAYLNLKKNHNFKKYQFVNSNVKHKNIFVC
jgi:hypothetical protein